MAGRNRTYFYTEVNSHKKKMICFQLLYIRVLQETKNNMGICIMQGNESASRWGRSTTTSEETKFTGLNKP